MAIFHLSVKRIGGGSGRSSVGAAAYQRGEKIRNERDGMTHNYTYRNRSVGVSEYHSRSGDFTQKSDIVHNEIMLPKHAPETFRDSATLWNSVEKTKKQHNEQTSRMIIVALPNELSEEQNIELVRDYVQRNFVNEGMCADFSVHAGHVHDQKEKIYPFEDLAVRKDNPHAHIQLTVRPLNEDGTWANKAKREYILDANGARIRGKNGKGWRSNNINLTNWEKTETLIKWRENWAETVNREFERLGIEERISHETLEKQGIKRTPTKHMGHQAWNVEKKGVKTRIGDENREIMRQNRALEHEATAEYLHELKEAYVKVDQEISETKQKISDIEQKSRVARFKVEGIEERTAEIETRRKHIEQLQAHRAEIGYFTSKKAIDNEIQNNRRLQENATRYFTHEYKIAPENARAEIKRLESIAREADREKARLQASLPAMLADKEAFANEYRRQKLLVEIHRDRARILARIEGFEKKSSKATQSVRKKMARIEGDRKLDVSTNEEEISRKIRRLRSEGELILSNTEISKFERQYRQLDLAKEEVQNLQKGIAELRQKRTKARPSGCEEIDRHIFFLEKAIERDTIEIERRIEQLSQISKIKMSCAEASSQELPSRSDRPHLPDRLPPSRELPSREYDDLIDFTHDR